MRIFLLFWFGARVLALDNGLGLTPQMGWNSWNFFGCDGINEELIKGIAQAMVSTGLKDLGYEYINLDDCWQVSRNQSGHIVEDFDKFPSGMKGLSHSIRIEYGLKFGVYSDCGLFTCQRRPGSFGHEVQDAESYVEWEVDYLKYDNCYASGLGGGVQKRYERMRDALNATSVAAGTKPIFFGMCEWGNDDPAVWAKPVGNSWRTTGDIQKSWGSILSILDQNDKWHGYAGPGGWNDPDMLQVGSPKLSVAEQRSHFTLWALIKSPLLLAMDLREIPPELMEIISNPEIIAINQDPLGIQGYNRPSFNGKDLEIWAGDLQGGDMAVVLFNRSPQTGTIAVSFEDLLDDQDDRITSNTSRIATATRGGAAGPPRVSVSVSAHVRDLWARKDLGVHKDGFQAAVPSHDVMALRLSGITVEKLQRAIQ